jgi:enolase-phosphatase E1
MMIQAILTDIEGTTSSIAFVHETLFPFAREHMGAFIRKHAQREDVAKLLEAARAEAGLNAGDDALQALLGWMDKDKKVTPLKALQGLIWEEGYRSGALKGHIYEDAVEGLKQWHKRGLKLYVYSSGSIYAQKLLFGYSKAGDLTPLFTDYFDTTSGHKREAASYRHIAEAIGLAASDILFLSDIAQELDAADSAGYQTIQLVRDADIVPSDSHTKVSSFDGIEL